jgi:hypothetical protein
MTSTAKTSGFRAFLAAAALGAFSFAESAGATTLIDFTDRTQWDGKGAGANYSYDYGLFSATISTNPPQSANFVQNFDGPQSSSYCQANSGPIACGSDGLGVLNDEIGFGQSVTVTFSRALHITSLHFLDLFKSTNDNGHERASLYLNGDSSAAYHFDAVEVLGASNGVAEDDTRPLGGYLFANVNFSNVNSMTFFAMEGFTDDADNDFALAGIDVQAVPLPAAGWLLIGGLGTLIALRRRKNTA